LTISLFPNLSSFTISQGFKNGVNTLDFVVYEPDGYDGLRVAGLTLEASPMNAASEPSGLLLAAVGTIALAVCGRRRLKEFKEAKE
jgi:hypothetical protein